MIFRNVTFFQFPVPTHRGLWLTQLAAGLEECRLRPVGPLELASRGFIPPMGRDSADLMPAQPEAVWLTVGTEERILPGAVVADLLAKKLAELEQQEGRKPGGKTRRRIKEDLVAELLPRAFVKPSRVDAVILPGGLLAIDTASRKVAEMVVGEIRRALGSFPALPLNAELAPRAVLTGWLMVDFRMGGLSLGDEATLADPADKGATVKLTRQELVSEEVTQHLEAGKQCTRLALTLDDHVAFTLGEDLVLRKFRLLDGAIQALESEEREDLEAELFARLALTAGELRRVWAVLQPALRISEVAP